MSKAKTHKLLQNYADYIDAAMPDFKYCGPEENIQNLARSLNQFGHNSILLTGPAGIGRRSLISGFVQNLAADYMPIEMMNQSVYRLNVQELFNTQNIAEVEARFTDVLDELKSIKRRTGKKPILAVDDGSSFAKEVTDRKASSLLNKMKSADIGTDDFDLVLSMDNDALHLMKKHYPNHLSHFMTEEVEQADDEYVTEMLTHEAKRYQAQKLEITPEAIEKVIELCNRYPALGRFSMPKNASVFLDEVATACRLYNHSRPEGVVEKEAEVEALNKKLAKASDAEKADLESQIQTLEACIAEDSTQWDDKKQAIKKIKDNISKNEGLMASDEENIEDLTEKAREQAKAFFERLLNSDKQEHLKYQEMTFEEFWEKEATAKLMNQSAEIPKLKKRISSTASEISKLNEAMEASIAKMIYPITLTPDFIEAYAKTKLGMNDVPNIRKLIRTAKDDINNIVMGQDQMVEPLIGAIKQRLSRKSEANKPMGVFLLLGPSGVGKTFIAEVIAEELCGGNLSVMNMEGFKEKHTVSRMIGAPPGYAGYDEKAELVKISESNPSGVILLDEIEKAHLDVKQALLTPLDKGKFTSANGKDSADFRDNIFILTSNFGQQDIILPQADQPFEEWSDQLKEQIFKAQDDFSPEFLNRCTIICADFLSEDVIRKVVAKRVKSFAAEYVGEDEDFSVEMDEESIARFVSDHYKKKNGARIVQTILEQQIGEHISDLVLDNDANDENTCGHLKVCYNNDEFTYELADNSVTLTANNENNAGTVDVKTAASGAFSPKEATIS